MQNMGDALRESCIHRIRATRPLAVWAYTRLDVLYSILEKCRLLFLIKTADISLVSKSYCTFVAKRTAG